MKQDQQLRVGPFILPQFGIERRSLFSAIAAPEHQPGAPELIRKTRRPQAARVSVRQATAPPVLFHDSRLFLPCRADAGLSIGCEL